MTSLLGKLLGGRYELIEKIGDGGWHCIQGKVSST